MSSDQQMLDIMNNIGGLLYRRLKQKLSIQEEIELQNWLNQQDYLTREFLEECTEYEQLLGALNNMYQVDEDAAFKDIKKRAGIDDTTWAPMTPNPRNGWRWYRLILAACVIAAFASITFILVKHKTSEIAQSSDPQQTKEQILPGGNKATLVLADGSHIDLEKAGLGSLSKQGNSQVIKADGDQLIYRQERGRAAASAYNTIYTPIGGQYRVVLSDRTVVYLNAASSLTYPSSFNGTTREVVLSGEAYFDVTKDQKMPFIVKVDGLRINVLGTRMNIMAYKDEPKIQTTLLAGSISVEQGKTHSTLRPGEQANVGDRIIINKVDTAEFVAWRSGYFSFTDVPLDAVMRDIARWYNVKVEFDEPVSDRKISARLSRSKNAEEILKVIQAGGVHFLIKDRTIHVTR